MSERLEVIDVKIRRIRDAGDSQVIALVARSDAYLDSLYPADSNHAESTAALLTQGAAFFGGYAGETLVACGAVKIVAGDEPYGEIKRVFVADDHRGKRLASAMMVHLEGYLRADGMSVVRLEVGIRQPEALGLYRKLGYAERGPFGCYVADPLSVFLEKAL